MPNAFHQTRIAILVGTLGQGGAERQLLYMLRAMPGMGMQPAVLSTTQGDFYEERIRELGVQIFYIGGNGNRLIRLWRVFQTLRKLRSDIVMSLHYFMNLYGAIPAKLLRLPSIGGIRGAYHDDIAPLGRLSKLSTLLPGVIAANSTQAIELAVADGADRSRLFFLPNVVDTDAFYPVPEKSQSHALRIALIGRISEQKRVDRFLRLLERLKHICPVEGRIYGKGPLQPEMEQLAVSLGLNNSEVRFMGPVAQTLPVYHECDMMLLTSDWEGTPNVVLEAMACGVPVVSTEAGGVPTIIRNRQDGLIVPVSDEDALFNAVVELYRDPELRNRLGASARNRAVELYSVVNLNQHLRKLFSLARI